MPLLSLVVCRGRWLLARNQDPHDARRRKSDDSFPVTRETVLTTDRGDGTDAGQPQQQLQQSEGEASMVFRLETEGYGQLVVEALHPLDFTLWVDSLRKMIQAKEDAYREVLRKANPSMV